MGRFEHVWAYSGRQERVMRENAILLRCDHDDDARRAELRHAKIGRLAYYIWQIGGEQTGQDEVDWLIAEHILETAKFRTPRDTDTPAIAHAEVSGKCQDSVPGRKETAGIVVRPL